jgi:hypothetical protein
LDGYIGKNENGDSVFFCAKIPSENFKDFLFFSPLQKPLTLKLVGKIVAWII